MRRALAVIALAALVVACGGTAKVGPVDSSIVVDYPRFIVREFPMENGVTCYVYSQMGARGGISCVFVGAK